MKEKNTINRSDLNNNILKQIIIRVDYKNIVEINKEIIEKIQFYLKDKSFTDYSEETENILESNNVERITVYKFSDENSLIELKISKYYTYITLKIKKYNNFEIYKNIIVYILLELKNKNPLLKIQRMGIRKINSVIIKNLNLLYNYFENNYFPLLLLQNNNDITDFENIKNEFVDVIRKDEANYNIKRVIISGEQTDIKEKIFQIILDIDGYIVGNEIKEAFFEEKNINQKINNINDMIFEIFKKSITQEFLNNLLNKDFEFTELNGVLKNE